MTTVVKSKPKLSLFKQPDPEPLSIVDNLRTDFSILNNKMFEQINNPEIKDMMTTISNKCLDNFGKVYNCDYPQTIKSSRKIITTNFVIGSDHFISKVSHIHVYSCDGVVYKKYDFLITNLNSFFKLVLEICLQKYAASLDCGMKIPEIYDYSLSQNGNGLDCFERNGLYHNDTHSDNIGFYEEDGSIKVVLMDFGNATLTDNNRYQSPYGFYKEIDDRSEFEHWLSNTIQENTGRRSFYGGRRKRRLTKNKKNRKSRYTYKRRGRK